MAHAASRSQTVQGCGGGAGQQDGAHGLGAAGSRRHLSETCAGGSAVRGCRWEDEAAYVRPRTARVMTTLMRNGRDRRSENPLLGQARIERVVLVGTDQRITSGPAATAAASRPRETSERKQAVYMAAPERFAESQTSSLALRAPSIHGPQPAVRGDAAIWPLSVEHRTLALDRGIFWQLSLHPEKF